VLHNNLRYHLINNLSLNKGSIGKSRDGLLKHQLTRTFLAELERIEPSEIENDTQSVIEYLWSETFIELKRVGGIQNLSSVLKGEFNSEILACIELESQHPIVPMRKGISQEEWVNLHKTLETKIKKQLSYEIYADDDPKFGNIIDNLIISSKNAYLLNPLHWRHSSLLSLEWLAEFYEGNDYCWVDPEYKWAIVADGHGYPLVYGATQDS
jgi:hypothetical protein